MAVMLRRGAAAAAAAAPRRGGRRCVSAGAPPPLMEGMLVVELASVLAGPTVCQFLSELGAEVVKVENAATRGDVTRTWRLASERGEGASDVTAYFAGANLNKRSIAIDGRKPEGLKLMQDLAASADVVVASYKPGDAEKLGVDGASLRARNPRLVYAQITGYGHANPRPGYDAVIQAESGFQFINGEPDSSPTKMPVALMDLLAAHQLKQAILLALWNRDRSGEGSVVDVSLLQAGVSALANQATGYLIAGQVPGRLGSDHPSICPYGTVFETGDGKLMVLGVGSDKQWRELCTVLGHPELGTDPRFQTNPLRVENRETTKATCAEMLRKVPSRSALLDQLAARAVPAGAVNDMQDVFAQPEADELVVRDGGGAALGVRQVAAGFAGGGAFRGTLPPPRYAEHTEDVLQRRLGLDAAAVGALTAQGAVTASAA